MTDYSKAPGTPSSTSPRALCEELNELDQFEQDLVGSTGNSVPLRLQTSVQRPARAATHRWWMTAGGFAVAASLLVMFMMNRNTQSVSPYRASTPSDGTLVTDTGKTNGETRGTITALPVAAVQDSGASADTHATVLLTIVEGSDPATGLPCDTCRTVDLIATSGKEQKLLAHSEPAMIQDALNRTCSPSARRVVVVGLSGPARSLPKTEAQATQLAQCIMTAPGAGSPGGDANVISNAAAACMPANVAVQVWAGSR